MEYLKEVCKHHKEWIRIVTWFKGYGVDPEDVVQDMYLELTKEIPVRSIEDKRVNPKFRGLSREERVLSHNGDINRAYIWILLKKCHLNALSYNKKLDTITLSNEYEVEAPEDNLERDNAFIRYNDKLQEEINSWHYYDSLMFNIYMTENISLRGLAKSTGISLSSVVNTINNCKDKIRENLGEDYQDLINKDYELI